MKALILSCGGSSKPLLFCIKHYQPDFIYFLCSNDSVDIARDIAEESNIDKDNFAIKVVSNHQSLEDSFAKSREIILELQKEYGEIHVDFTGGTKPMVSGLVLAAIGEECTYSYVGTENIDGRDKQGLGIVIDGFEQIKNQRDPYDVFAVMEFNRGMDFFNKYQFEAAKTNFTQASEKLESENLIELANLYKELVDVYQLWDKFKNTKGKKLTLNNIFNNILKLICNSDNIKNHLMDNFPDFIPQIRLNKEFLDLKLSREGRIKPENVKYYLPDLLNNSLRRIEEGKYDDAVARLYRSIELIAQMSLTEMGIINKNNLWGNAGFSINVLDVESKFELDDDSLYSLNDYEKAKENGNTTFGLALKNSYILLSYLDSQFAKDYLNDDEIQYNLRLRNVSILAHGLKAISRENAENLYSQVFKYAKIAFPEIEKYMEMSKFPKFE